MKTSFSLVLFLFASAGGLRVAAQEPKPIAAPAVAFRVIFASYDGNPQTDKPEKMNFQVNTIDFRQPAEFLKLGEWIPNTRLKLDRFAPKQRKNQVTGVAEDVSELTLINTDTGNTIVVVLGKWKDVSSIFTPSRPTTK